MTDHLNDIKGILSLRFGVADDLITQGSKLAEDLNLSKIEITDLLTILTQKYHLSLSEDIDLDSILTVSDVLLLLEENHEDL